MEDCGCYGVEINVSGVGGSMSAHREHQRLRTENAAPDMQMSPCLPTDGSKHKITRGGVCVGGGREAAKTDGTEDRGRNRRRQKGDW